MVAMHTAFVSGLLCALSAPSILATPIATRDVASTATSSTSSLTVDLGYGIYQGVHDSTTNLNVWKGIRYAAPPTGDQRWRPPTPPSVNRSATINAASFGPACPQALPAPQNVPLPGNEDCLFLNVYAPTVQSGKTLPVLVWIHGAGYGYGDGTQDMSEIINANDNGFLAVTIQYRLGVFGFLSSAKLAANGVANAGILDQAFALLWVQGHILQFGGDPTRVTISGESSGAGSVMLLSIANGGTLGTSLFQSGIAASPYLPPQYDYNGPISEQKYAKFLSQTGCSQATDTVACLRSKDSTTLQTANTAMNAQAFYGNWAFLPVTDYKFIQSVPSTALTKQQVNGKHILVGQNADEGSLFVPQNINSADTLKSWLQGAFPNLNSTSIQRIIATYPVSSTASSTRFATSGFGPANALNTSPVATGIQQLANNIYAEATFICPSYWLNDAFTSQSRTSYHYQYSIPVAIHTSDVSAYFGPATPNQPPVFTSVFRHIWGAQIALGTPTTGISNPAWPAWSVGSASQMLNLNTTGGTPYQTTIGFGVNVVATQFMNPGIQNNITVVNAKSWEAGRGNRCEFWRQIGSLVPI